MPLRATRLLWMLVTLWKSWRVCLAPIAKESIASCPIEFILSTMVWGSLWQEER